MDIRAILLLNHPRRPAAIRRLIVAIDIDAVDRQIFSVAGALSPFCKRRIVSPLRTNRNPFSAVVLKVRTIGIYASLNHVRPYNVKTRTASSVFGASLNRLLDAKTTTALRFPFFSGRAQERRVRRHTRTGKATFYDFERLSLPRPRLSIGQKQGQSNPYA